MSRLIGVLLTLLCAAPAVAQTAPPIHGVTGTVATDATIDAEAGAARGIAGGVARLVGATRKMFSFGGTPTNQNLPDTLIEGTRVVVRSGADASNETTTEGVVIDVNRKRQQITIRLADRKTDTLRLTVPGGTADVVVSYSDQAGSKIVGAFTRVP